jgi:hypothetical protein
MTDETRDNFFLISERESMVFNATFNNISVISWYLKF